jgi:hypothetical protein
MKRIKLLNDEGAYLFGLENWDGNDRVPSITIPKGTEGFFVRECKKDRASVLKFDFESSDIHESFTLEIETVVLNTNFVFTD